MVLHHEVNSSRSSGNSYSSGTQLSKVLVVAAGEPDGPDLAELLAPLCDVHAETNLAESVRAVRDNRYAVIFCDLSLQLEDGRQLLYALGCEPAVESAMLVATCKHVDGVIAQYAQRLGADEILPTACSPDELRTNVAAFLAKSTALHQPTMPTVHSESYSSLAHELPHLIWAHDESGNITWANRRFHDFVGQEAQQHNPVIPWSDIIAADDFSRYFALIAEAFSQRKIQESRIRLRAVNGAADAFRLHLVRVVPFQAGPQDALALVTTATDIHEMSAASAMRDRDLEALAEVMPQIVWQIRSDGYHEYFNQTWYDFTGLNAVESYGEAWTKAVHCDDYDRVCNDWLNALENKITFDTEFRLRHHSGVYRWFLTRGRPLHDGSGHIVRWLGTCTDIDDHKRDEQVHRFVSDAMAKISVSSDILETCRTITNHAIENVADFCIFDLHLEDGTPNRIAWAHRDPEARDRMAACTDFAAESFGNPLGPYQRTINAKSVQLIHGWDSSWNDAERVSPAYRAFLKFLDLGSLVTIPIIGFDDIIGVLWLGRTTSGPRFAPSDLAALRDVGRQVGSALDSARQSQRNRLVADRFQHAALPKNLPNIPGVHFSAVYRAAKSEAFIGGDWYDAFPLTDGRIVISIGDVMGTGLDAAVTMGAVRQTIRGATQIYPDPVTVLNAADRTLRTEQPDRIVTAFVGVLDPLTMTLVYASAGHPPPFLRCEDGAILELAGSGLPLGLRDTGENGEIAHHIMVPDPCLLVLYTDGLTEATHDIAAGEEMLRQAMNHRSVLNSETPADAIANIALDQVRDDLAILAVSIDSTHEIDGTPIPERRETVRWKIDSRNSSEAQQFKAELVATLRTRGYAEANITITELILSELLGNVLRHTDGSAEIVMDMSGKHPVLHVMDRGPGFTFHAQLPHNVMSESGRGLFIASRVAEDLSVVPRQDGGSHARVVLPFCIRRPIAA